MPDLKKTEYYKLFKTYQDDFKTRRATLKEIANYLLPGHNAALIDPNKPDDGSKRYDKIIDGKGTEAVQILASFLLESLTSPTKPWFRLSVEDDSLLEFYPVKQWLHETRDIMLNIFSRSNIYSSLCNCYLELSAFGTACMFIEEDFNNVIRFRPFNIGSYYLGLDSSYKPAILCREFSMSASQMVEKFGYDNLTTGAKSSIDNNNKEARYDIINMVQPKKYIDPLKLDSSGMLYESVYFQPGETDDKFLGIQPFSEKPFVAARWKTVGVDTYGEGQGHLALGDIKMLQKEQEKKLKALHKMVDPPLNAPIDLKQKGANILPGGINWISNLQQNGVTPVYQINLDFEKISYEIKEVEQRIKNYFFNDLILAMISTDKEMTATESNKREVEKISVIGYVVTACQNELLDPTIIRSFNIINSLGYLPPMPQEMQGIPLKIEYISSLAQAQKMMTILSLEQLTSFVGSLSAVVPQALDKYNADEAIDIYAEILGVPPKITRTDDEVEKIRIARLRQIQQQQQMEQLGQLAQGAKVMSDTKVGDNNALEAILGG